jgi:hypothetical protein
MVEGLLFYVIQLFGEGFSEVEWIEKDLGLMGYK